MIIFQYCLFLLLAAAAAKAYSLRSKVPFELLLLMGSLAISLIPGVPYVSIPSEVILFVFMPPVLFSAAYFTSQRDFYANMRPILMLAVGLVFATVLSVGYIVHWLIPEIPLAIGFLLGAIVAPPDAAAAAAFAKQLHLPRKVVTILEGESLLNDATALTAYRFALAAALSGTFSMQDAIGGFLFIAVGGAIIGLLIGWVGLKFILVIKNSTAETMVSLVVAFLCYYIAETLHLSGVIAAVAGGLYFGKRIPEHVSAETRIEAKATWNVMLLSLNGVIFTVIGLQLPTIAENVWHSSGREFLILSAGVFLALILTRAIWIFTIAYSTVLLFPTIRKREGIPSWKNLSIITWSGMRGIVTLATVVAVPETLADGSPFPYRDLLFAVSYAMIILTLVIPSLTLPSMVKYFKFPIDLSGSQESAKVRLAMARAGLAKLKDDAANSSADVRVERLQTRYQDLIDRLNGNLSEESAFSTVCNFAQDERRNIKKILQAERLTLRKLRSENAMHDEIFHELNEELDLEELRLRKNVRPLF